MKRALLPALALLLSLSSQAQRVVLVEYFTQASCLGCPAQDTRIQAMLDANPDKAVGIFYHTGFPGADPMNQPGAADAAARLSYYSLSALPRSAVEGRVISTGHPSQWNQDTLLARAARPSPFALRVRHRIRSQAGADTLLVTVTVRRTGALPAGALALQTAVVERGIRFGTAPGTNGQREFDWVMKKMLPTAAGQSLPALAQGDSVRYTFKWGLQNVYNPSSLTAVAFVQSVAAKTVYQAALSVPVAPVTMALQNLGSLAAVAGPADTGRYSFRLTTSSAVPLPVRVRIRPEGSASPGVTALLSDGAAQAADSLEVTASAAQPATITVRLTSPDPGVRYKATLLARPLVDSLGAVGVQTSLHLLGKARTLLISLDAGSAATVLSSLSQRDPFLLSADEFAEVGPAVLDPANYRHAVLSTGSQYTRTLTEGEKNALEAYLLAGGNLAVLGQSFGYGTAQTATAYLQPFLHNYLGATRQAAGTQFLTVRGEPSDTIFGRFTSQSLVGQSGQTAWPDMYALSTANPAANVAFRYSNQQVAGTYCLTSAWRSVFLGFGAEQVQVSAIRRQILNRIIDFFEGFQVGIADLARMQPLQVLPNPAAAGFRVRGPFRPGQAIMVADLSGRRVLTRPVTGTGEVLLDAAGLAPGLYQVLLSEGGRTIGQGRMAVMR